MSERRVTITEADVEFVRKAKRHYEIFAETADKQGDARVAGTFRAQEFYAERFLTRIGGDDEK